MEFTPEQELAVGKFQKALLEYKKNEAIANLFVFVMSVATLLLPIILAFATKNYGNLLLWLIYPFSSIFMGQLRYSKMNIILLILLGNIGVMYFIRLIGAPEWYATVFVGLSFSNYMLLTQVPILRKKVETLGEDPDFVAVRDQIK